MLFLRVSLYLFSINENLVIIPDQIVKFLDKFLQRSLPDVAQKLAMELKEKVILVSHKTKSAIENSVTNVARKNSLIKGHGSNDYSIAAMHSTLSTSSISKGMAMPCRSSGNKSAFAVDNHPIPSSLSTSSTTNRCSAFLSVQKNIPPVAAIVSKPSIAPQFSSSTISIFNSMQAVVDHEASKSSECIAKPNIVSSVSPKIKTAQPVQKSASIYAVGQLPHSSRLAARSHKIINYDDTDNESNNPISLVDEVDVIVLDSDTETKKKSPLSPWHEKADQLVEILVVGLEDEAVDALHHWIISATSFEEFKLISNLLKSTFSDFLDLKMLIAIQPQWPSQFKLQFSEFAPKLSSPGVLEPKRKRAKKKDETDPSKHLEAVDKSSVISSVSFGNVINPALVNGWPLDFVDIVSFKKNHPCYSPLMKLLDERVPINHFQSLPNISSFILKGKNINLALLRLSSSQFFDGSLLSILRAPVTLLKNLESRLSEFALESVAELHEIYTKHPGNLSFLLKRLEMLVSCLPFAQFQRLIFEMLHEGLFANSVPVFNACMPYVRALFSADMRALLEQDYGELQLEMDPIFLKRQECERKARVQALISKICQNQILTREASLKCISATILDLEADNDALFSSTGINLMLNDPFTLERFSLLFVSLKRRIIIPARSSTCNHIQCFDLFSHINLNIVSLTRERKLLEGKKKDHSWKCPVCAKQCRVGDIIVDPTFLDILKSTNEKKVVRCSFFLSRMQILLADGRFEIETNHNKANESDTLIDLTTDDYLALIPKNSFEMEIKEEPSEKSVFQTAPVPSTNLNVLTDKQILGINGVPMKLLSLLIQARAEYVLTSFVDLFIHVPELRGHEHILQKYFRF